MTMTILTHPFQALMMAVVLTRVVRLALSGAADHGTPIQPLAHRQVS